MFQLILIATVSLVPPAHVLRESVDLMEVNHFYDEHARPIFSQVIFYDWDAAEFSADSTGQSWSGSGGDNWSVTYTGHLADNFTVKAMYELERVGGRYGLITMCIGGGQGIAMVIERCA